MMDENKEIKEDVTPEEEVMTEPAEAFEAPKATEVAVEAVEVTDDESEEPSKEQTPYFDNTITPAKETGERRTVAAWHYEEQNSYDKKQSAKEGKQNARTFAVVMSCVFAGSILVLILAMVFGGLLYRDEKVIYKEIYVREDGSVVGDLTVGEVYQKGLPSTVEVSVSRTDSVGTGTGIILNDIGYIITNAHVVEKANSVSVKLYDETVFKATVIGEDALADVAVIKIDPGSYKLTPAVFGKSSELLVGDGVVAIGCPAGLFLTCTNGIVSAPIRMIEVHSEKNSSVEKEVLMIQTSTELNPGNSGGPLFNMKGEVVGINSMKLVFANDGTPYEGLGYAIPIDEAMILVARMINGEKTAGEGLAIKTMKLGITGSFCIKGEPDGKGGTFPRTGVYVSNVEPESNAYKKIHAGDIILSYNGKTLDNFDEFSSFLKQMKNGETLRLTVYRDGQVTDIEIVMDIAK